ncbi:hypothetical protein [Nonomuraea angiospora]|uniref:hypothetical protein n=1 Tax=Nonomuraea angiospora TaxID=46172 RepID=UPI0029B2A168|nr:hypothetical protein [Nonomuraea angiospora]MDX3111510.1 hypothetical protein [Nonomuraea angiospora]
MPSIPRPLDPHDDGGDDPAVAPAQPSQQSGPDTTADVVPRHGGSALLSPV